jgi:hypothetical protein
MDKLLDWKDLNVKWYMSILCPPWKRQEYTFIGKPRGLSLERHASTQCHTTCDAIKYLLTGQEEWQYTERPSAAVFQVILNEGDHTFIVHGNDVYQSYWNQYTLKKTTVSDQVIASIKAGYRFDTQEVLGMKYTLDVIECYEPRDTVDFSQMEARYERLDAYAIKEFI